MIKQLDKLGQEIFEKRYAYPGDKTWADRAKSIAKAAASAEKDDDKEKCYDKFYSALAAGDFIPGGRIIYGSGRRDQNLLNCYQISPEDNVKSIGKVLSDMYRISCGGGGIGFNFSYIRPKGDDIGNVKNSAPGAVSNMKMINEVGNHVKAGKNRRTALIAILNVTHPDLFEFLTVKLNENELNNFNISVGITDRFIEAVHNDEDWYFSFNNKKYYVYTLLLKHSPNISRDIAETYIDVPALNKDDAILRANQHYKKYFDDEVEFVEQKQIKAKDIWNLVFKNSVRCGDPGFYNIDLANRFTNVNYFEFLPSPNPCGEIPLPNYGNCCLGHINLSNMVDENGEVDWKKLARTVRTGVRFLDNILTINHFPIEECKEVGQSSRRIGLGFLGLHYMLIKLGIRYGSDKHLEFQERLSETIRNEAYLESTYLARDKGAFPQFNYKKYLDQEFAKTLPARIRMLIKEHGIRNAVMLTVAPTGTISMLQGTSSGIEPIFSWAYKRRFRDNNVWKETIVVDPLFREYYNLYGPGGFDYNIFAGAYDVTPDEHLAVQAAVQKYIDNSISKTINLPSDSIEDDKINGLSDTVLKYIAYLKGVTLYRASSKGNEPLEAIPLTKENVEKYMSLYEEQENKEELVADGTVCSINGDGCGA